MSMEAKAVEFTQTTDATVWAKAFVDRFGGIDERIDEALMIGWFANAIEKGRDTGHREGMEEERDSLYDMLGVLDSTPQD